MQRSILAFGKSFLNKNTAAWAAGFEASFTGRLTRSLRLAYQNSCTGRLLNRNVIGESRTFHLLQNTAGFIDARLHWPERWRARQREIIYAALFILAVMTALSFFLLPYRQAFVVLAAALLTVATFYRTEYGVYSAALLLPFVPLKALLGLALLTLASLMIKKARGGHGRLYLSPLFLPILVFFAVMFYATVTSVLFWDSLSEFFIPVTGLIYLFVIANTCDSREKLNNLVVCLVLAGLITASYATYQFYVGANVVELKKEWVDVAQNPDIKNRAYAVFDNPNLLAQYMILLSTLSLGAAFAAKKTGLRVFFAATTAIAVFCLVLTYSRGGWLAFAGALVVFALFKNKLLVQLLVVAGLLIYSALPYNIANRLATITSLKDTSNLYRLDTWNSTIELIKAHWETGVGLGRRAFARVYHTHMINSTVVPHSHNLYLQTISEFGILGLVVFCWLFISVFRLGLKVGRTTSAALRNLNAGVMAALTGFLLHSFVDHFIWYYKLGILIWLLVAIVIVMDKILSTEQNISERNEENAEQAG